MKRAILVKSCQKNRDRQQACRETWAGELVHGHGRPGCLPRGVRLYVLEGGHARTWPSGDVMECEVGDGYDCNSFKLRDALSLELGMLESPPDYYFICDDDTFVHPQRWLSHEPTGDIECRVYQPRNAVDWKRNNGRPWIHGGAGWWMSRKMCQLYVENCKERTSADDIVAARIAQEHGIELVDRPDLYGCNSYGGSAGVVSADNTLITCHPVKPEEIRTLHEATNGI